MIPNGAERTAIDRGPRSHHDDRTMSRPSLLKALRDRPLLCDGGMGTQLIARGLAAGESAERWNVDRADDVAAVHQAYRGVGCDLITTNTFQGTTTALTMHGLGERVSELNSAGVRNARAAAANAWVLGDVGPFGGFLEPVGETSEAQLEAIFTLQLTALHEGGADAIIIETMSDPAEVTVAVRAAKAIADWPVIATYAFERGFRTMMGGSADEAMKRTIDAGADVVGANCGTSLSLDDYVALARVLVESAGDVPVILQPNAGSPVQIDGRMVHPATPQDMAAIVPELLNIGVRIIGGCCGTTPAHLRSMSDAIRQLR